MMYEIFISGVWKATEWFCIFYMIYKGMDIIVDYLDRR